MVVLKSEVIGIFYAWRRPRPPSPKCFRLWLRRGKGPWKGAWVRVGLTPLEIDTGKCRGISNGARRGEPVIVVKKIDVHVNSTGVLGIYGQIGANNRS